MEVMKYFKDFNSANLTSAIKTCYNNPDYKLLIVAPRFVMPVSLIVIDCISKLYPDERNKFQIQPSSISFPNGSHIRIISQSSTARGYRVHKVLISDMLNAELIQVLAPMVRDYEEEQQLFKEN